MKTIVQTTQYVMLHIVKVTNSIVSYSYKEYTQLKNKTITAYEFKTSNGTDLYFDHKDVVRKKLKFL